MCNNIGKFSIDDVILGDTPNGIQSMKGLH